jgi:hypothetical protein
MAKREWPDHLTQRRQDAKGEQELTQVTEASPRNETTDSVSGAIGAPIEERRSSSIRDWRRNKSRQSGLEYSDP